MDMIIVCYNKRILKKGQDYCLLQKKNIKKGRDYCLLQKKNIKKKTRFIVDTTKEY